jgi:hypothetical protein
LCSNDLREMLENIFHLLLFLSSSCSACHERWIRIIITWEWMVKKSGEFNKKFDIRNMKIWWRGVKKTNFCLCMRMNIIGIIFHEISAYLCGIHRWWWW